MSALNILEETKKEDSTLILAFSGWMDGGSVSTGTVERLVELFSATRMATIDSEDYYLFNFPGSMELSSLFRPHIEIQHGLIKSVEMPTNDFYVHPKAPVYFFIGKEPNLRWNSFGNDIFEFSTRHNIARIIFVGSFGGTVPHTREPRLFATSCDESLLNGLSEFGIQQTDYSGPGSFTSYLMTRASEAQIDMFSIVAEIPSYLHGRNPMCIEAVTRRLAKVLRLPLDVDTLRSKSTDWELEISQMVESDEELASRVRELENDYDNQLIGLSPNPTDEPPLPFDDESPEF